MNKNQQNNNTRPESLDSNTAQSGGIAYSATPPLQPSASASAPLPPNLPDEVWDWLLKDAERFAAKHIHQYRWRGAKGGVLPGGFDANSIAAQAVVEFLQPSETRLGHRPVDQAFHSFLATDRALQSTHACLCAGV